MSRAPLTAGRLLSPLAAVLLIVTAAAVAAEPSPPIEFLRARVPRGRLEDVPLGAGRYVPMAAEEFERAVARIGPRADEDVAPRPLVERAGYELTCTETGQLVGRLTIAVSPAAAASMREIDLGALRPERCSLRTATGRGEAVVFGRDDGTVALRVTEAGTYDCAVRIEPDAAGGREYTLPLPPALATSIRASLPPGFRPLPTVAPDGAAVAAREQDGAWLIDSGPGRTLRLTFVAVEPEPPLAACWTDTRLRGSQVELSTVVVPRTAWPTAALRLEKSPGLRVVAVRAGDDGRPVDWAAEADGQVVAIRLPATAVGRSGAVVVEAVAPLDVPLDVPLPWVRVAEGTWAGGGTRVEIDPAFGLVGITAEACRAVTPETAAGWPLPARTALVAEGAAVQPAVMHLEHQSATATVDLSLQPRRPQLDVARVTTIDLSRGRVLGRAACDLRVLTGETYTVTAAVMPGWIIDSVQIVEPFDSATEPDERHADEGRPVDWQAGGGRGGRGELRVDLPLAATPRRGVGLRVTGHRAGVPTGSEFRAADMDMVRFEGETADGTAVDFNVGPDAVVEIDGAPLGVLPISARLARLVEPGAARARLPGGQRAADRRGRLVQRRPPLDARVDVRLAAQDELLGQAFRFTCRPEAAAVDSLVVHFSEPMGEQLQWSLVEPRGGSLSARRLDAGDDARGPGARLPGCAESWLVEIEPAFIGSVTLQAGREVAFREPQPVPLAWVEGATDARGVVTVEDTGRARLTVRNRRLRELPSSPVAGRSPALVEFAFAMPQAAAAAEAAAEVEPAAAAEARAWAWSGSLACWCLDSGQWECEADFDIENHGRDQVAINVPQGQRVVAVLLDGNAVPVESLDARGTIRLPLPPDRRRLRVVVRTVAQARTGPGMWMVDPICCAIDVPVLEQRIAVLLPPDLEAVSLGSGYRDAEPAALGLAARLLAATPAGAAARVSPLPGHAAGPAARMAGGFRERLFAPVPGRRAAGIVVVRRRLVAAAAVVVGFLAGVTALRLGRRGVAGAVLLTAAAAVLALWLEPPLGTVARAAWWGGLAGCVGGTIRRRGLGPTAAAWLVAIGACGLPAANAAEPAPLDPAPLRVFLTPGDGGDVALVPETLFRALMREPAPTAVATIRIRRCEVLVEEGQPSAAWRLRLDVDADAGGGIVLEQRAGEARWLPPTGGDDAVQVDENGQSLRLAPPAGGRRQVELTVVPATERRGRLEMATIDLPPAAAARLEFIDAQGGAVAAAAEAVQCDRSPPRGPFVRAAAVGVGGRPGFDVSGAARVRLVRPIDGRDSLASGVAAATSENEITWRLDTCRVRGRFEVAGEAIVRAVIVAADPRLRPVEQQAGDGQIVTPLGHGRHLIERVTVEPGPARFQLEMEMPVAEAVGVFDAPGAWLEAAETDARTVRVISSSDLQATLETRSAVGRGGEDGERQDALRYEAGRAAPAPPVRLSAVRRPQEIRGSQTLSAALALDGISLRLRCRIDATSTPLVEVPVEIPPGCDIERVMLREDDFVVPEGGPRSLVDLQWSLTAANRLTIFVQQPRAGRYRLEVDGRLPVRPEARGRIPLLRAGLAGGSPLVVLWRQDGLPESTTVSVEVPPGEPGPAYELVPEPPAAAGVREPPAADTGDGPGDRVERALVSATVDDRGRLRGLACYDLVASRSVIRLRLPVGTRLFDVLVDGRDAVARPVAEDAWELDLQAAPWPRTLLVVFAGEMEPAGGAGRPVRLLHPLIDGLPCREVLWTIDPPAGLALRVAAPARVLDAAAWQEACRLARGRIDAAFARARAGVDALEAERLAALAADRFGGRAAALEASRESAVEAAVASPLVRVVTPGDGGVTVRVVRQADPSLPARAAATVGLATIAALAWLASRRGVATWPWPQGMAARGGPWMLAAAGASWAALLVPAVPGLCLLAAGAAWAAMRRRSRLAEGAASAVRPTEEFSRQSLSGG